jgi:hypothetical protein
LRNVHRLKGDNGPIVNRTPFPLRALAVPLGVALGSCAQTAVKPEREAVLKAASEHVYKTSLEAGWPKVRRFFEAQGYAWTPSSHGYVLVSQWAQSERKDEDAWVQLHVLGERVRDDAFRVRVYRSAQRGGVRRAPGDAVGNARVIFSAGAPELFQRPVQEQALLEAGLTQSRDLALEAQLMGALDAP